MAKAKKEKKTKLKPCPFCGSIPAIKRFTESVEAIDAPVLLVQTRVKICCENCFLKMDVLATSIADLNISEKAVNTISRHDVNRVIENVWNVRANNG